MNSPAAAGSRLPTSRSIQPVDLCIKSSSSRNSRSAMRKVTLKSLHQDQQCEQPRFVQGGGEQARDLREIECAVIRQQRAQLRHAYTQEHIAVAVLSWRGFEKTPRLPNDFIVGHGL